MTVALGLQELEQTTPVLGAPPKTLDERSDYVVTPLGIRLFGCTKAEAEQWLDIIRGWRSRCT